MLNRKHQHTRNPPPRKKGWAPRSTSRSHPWIFLALVLCLVLVVAAAIVGNPVAASRLLVP